MSNGISFRGAPSFHLDGDGRVRTGAGHGPRFAGVATLPLAPARWKRAAGGGVADAGDVALRFRGDAGADRKKMWVLYCDDDGSVLARELVGSGGDDARWSGLELLRRALCQGVRRLSVVSTLAWNDEPLEIDLAQRRMFDRAAAALDVVIDHHVFVGGDGYYELRRSGEVVGHAWQSVAARPVPPLRPDFEGSLAEAPAAPPQLDAALKRRVASADDAETLARALLHAEERLALAVLHEARGGITGVFPVGCDAWLDESSAAAAFRAGFQGLCHRVLVLASGGGADWERRVETYLGPRFLAWMEEVCLLPSLTVLVHPQGRRYWGAIA